MALCTPAVLADADDDVAFPRSSDREVASDVFSTQGVAGNGTIDLGGNRDGDPLTSPVCDIPAANCQDRERINGPAYRLAYGRQNNSFFKRFDEFRLASSGFLKEVCIRVELLNPENCMSNIDNPVDPDCGCIVAEPPDPMVCDPALQDDPMMPDPMNCSTIVDPDPHPVEQALFQVTVWTDNFGVPGIIAAGPWRADFDGGTAADINTSAVIVETLIGTWGFTGDSIGFGTPTFLETGVHLEVPTAGQVQLNAEQCYWLELDMDDKGAGCFMLLVGSPEAEPGQGIGNMRSITFDATIRQTLDVGLDFRSFDIHYCLGVEDSSGAIGSGTAVDLITTNDPLDFLNTCSSKTVPTNNNSDAAELIQCGDIDDFDNSWADVTTAFGNGVCRKNVNEDAPSPRGDLYYLFRATEPDELDPMTGSAIIGLCSTNTLVGESGGDAIIQVFAFSGDPFNPPANITPADVFEIGCSDDSCGNLPQICLTNLQLNAFFMVRIHTFSYASPPGEYRLSLNCPCPFIENDVCEDAFAVPLANPGFTDELGILVQGNTSNGNVESVPGGCDGTLRIEAKNGTSFIGSNTAWYALPGQGQLVFLNTDQQFIGEDYDTDVAIYCSEDNSCDDLTCIGSNDDIDADVSQFKSQIIFCGILGKTYYIAMHGTGTQAGDFGVLIRQLRDQGNNFIECCANANQCVSQATYFVPPNALDELNFPMASAEGCDDGSSAMPPFQPSPDIDGNNNGCSGPASDLLFPGSYAGTFHFLEIGVPVTGSLYSLNGGRDNDEYLFTGMSINGEDTIVDYSFQTMRPARMRPEAVFSLYGGPCAGLAIGSWTNFPTFANQRINQRNHFDVAGSFDNELDPNFIDDGMGNQILNPDWQPTMSYTIRNRLPGAGTPCGVRDRYWFLLNDALDARDCPAVATPSGDFDGDLTPDVLTVDNAMNPLVGDVTLGDIDNERFQPTFGHGEAMDPFANPAFVSYVDPIFGFDAGTSGVGACGAVCQADPQQGDAMVCNGEGSLPDVFAGEECESRKASPASCVGSRNVNGCNITPNFDGDFIWLRPNIPMIGSIDGQVSSSGVNRDIDWYKFRLGSPADVIAGRQFAVTLDLQSGHCMQFSILEDRCANNIFDQIPYGVAATTGDCLSRTLVANDVMILRAGIYVVTGLWGDIFSFNNGTTFIGATCSFSGDPLSDPNGITKYILTVNAEPLPECSVDTMGTDIKTAEAFEGCPVGVNPLPEQRPSNCPGEGNDGCVVGTFQSDSIASGEVVRGQLYTIYEAGNTTQNFLTDQDNYSFDVAANSFVRLTYSAVADGPVRVQVLGTGAGGSLCIADDPFGSTGFAASAGNTPRGGVRVLHSADALLCDALANGVGGGVVHLSEGSYSLAVAPGSVAFGLAAEDLSCDENSQLEYTLSVTIEEVGTCEEVADQCEVATQAECGVALDPGLPAAGFDTGVGGAFSTIDTQGGANQVVFGAGEDPDRVVMALGGSFDYYGVSYNSIAISDNGHIVLGGTGDANTATVRDFPDVGSPNPMVGALFHDWDAPSSSVFANTSGGSTTVEWQAVSASNTRWTAEFQLVLNHSDGGIEIRYGAFANGDASAVNPNTLADALFAGYEFTSGVEDPTGLVGLSIVPNLGGNVSTLLTVGESCAAPICCLGNAAKEPNGQVVFSDITAVLSNWLGSSTPADPDGSTSGDANCDGEIKFEDVTVVLSNWLDFCP